MLKKLLLNIGLLSNEYRSKVLTQFSTITLNGFITLRQRKHSD